MAREIITLVTQVSCNSITRKQSQTLNIRVNYSYQGPAKTVIFRAWVTHEFVSEFNKIGSTEKAFSVNLPESLTPTSSYSNITGLPLSGCEAKSGYGVLVRVEGLDSEPEWGAKNVLTVESEVPEAEINVTSLSLS